MDVTTAILLTVMVILLLLAAYMVLLAQRFTAGDKKQGKGHACKECIFCNAEGNCLYFHEEHIDQERPACKHYEEKEFYRPA